MVHICKLTLAKFIYTSQVKHGAVLLSCVLIPSFVSYYLKAGRIVEWFLCWKTRYMMRYKLYKQVIRRDIAQ